MRRAARVDANQAQIVEALRQAGASVWHIKWPVDLLVGFQGKTLPMEVKDGDKRPSARTLTPDQEEFMRTWNGGPVAIVTDIEGALRALKVIA